MKRKSTSCARLLIAIFFIASGLTATAQTVTKQQSLDALKQTLQGQIIVYDYGGPCSGSGNSSYREASYITVSSVKYEYSQIIIEYFYMSNNKQVNNIKRINMSNYFVSIGNAIFESKQPVINSDYRCKDTISMALAFSEDAKAGQEKSLKILLYLKKFAEKDPFD